MENPFPEFGENDRKNKNANVRLRDISLRLLVPNLITLCSICAGLTGIRLAMDDRFELALIAVLFAALLDGIDGRVARLLDAATLFGEQMDSLADFVNFGVAPAMILYLWNLHHLGSIGWMIVLIFAVCVCLRLARFNVMLASADEGQRGGRFFIGVPAPAGACLGLLPIYFGLLGLERNFATDSLSGVYILLVAFLMVSNVPTWSGKQLGGTVSRRWVLAVILGTIFFIVFLFSYPWLFLVFLCLSYLACVPFSIKDYNRASRKKSGKKQKRRIKRQ